MEWPKLHQDSENMLHMELEWFVSSRWWSCTSADVKWRSPRFATSCGRLCWPASTCTRTTSSTGTSSSATSSSTTRWRSRSETSASRRALNERANARERSVEPPTTSLQRCSAKKGTATKWMPGLWGVLCEWHSLFSMQILRWTQGMLDTFEVSNVWNRFRFDIICRYTLLVGKPPFETKCLKDTYQKIKDNDYELKPKLSSEAKNLIKSLLRSDPSSRPSMEQILQDEFFTCGKKIIGFMAI